METIRRGRTGTTTDHDRHVFAVARRLHRRQPIMCCLWSIVGADNQTKKTSIGRGLQRR